MPNKVLTRRRSMVARLTVVAMIASLMALGAAPASAATIDTSVSCPSTTPSAGFTDIGTLDAGTQLAINCIASFGITSGTSATTFSPLADVPRWQMALFLTRQATAHGVALGTGADQGFTDIAAFDAATVKAINQIKQLGVTLGTSATTFDPNGIVTREQMALFLARFSAAAGVSLAAAPADAFTDDAALSAASQLAINQLAAAGIAAGTSATTFSPAANNARWHMALFLSRVLAADSIVPAGTGFIVTAKDIALPGLSVSYADTVQGKVVKATLKTAALGDQYFVDGGAASQAAFLIAASVGDLLAVNGQVFNLTNKTASSYKSGVIDSVTPGSFDIVEPISGVVLSSKTTGGTYQLYTTDGSAVSVAGFDLDANAGDTVVITGSGTVTSIQTVALSNQTISGTVKNEAAPAFGLKPFADTFTATATDALTVDGVAVTLSTGTVNWNNSLTDGDSVTYSMKGGKQTIALTNGAMAAVAGKVLDNSEIGIDAVDVDASGTWSHQSYVGAEFVVNGLIDDIAGFEAALTAGDSISIVRADGDVNLVDRVTLTDAAFAGEPASANGTVVAVFFYATSATASEAIDYLSMTPDLDISGTTATKYTINGVAAADAAAWTLAVTSAITNGGTVSVSKVGTALVWNIAS